MNKTILVVEDEKPLMEAIRVLLESRGFLVITARTVDDALSGLEDGTVDAVWLDHYLLGKENGLAFVAKMKESGSEWSDIPVFVVSNTASEEHVQSYMKLGAKSYYIKAENKLGDIIDEIRTYLEDTKSV